MKIISPAFKDQDPIPPQYTCDGADINPPLEFQDIPIETASLALVVSDPDSAGGNWIHWLVWNIDPATKKLREASNPPNAVFGLTSFNKNEWGGPCPPSGTHRYIFTLYALDSLLDLAPETAFFKFEQVIRGHIIAQADLTGNYARRG